MSDPQRRSPEEIRRILERRAVMLAKPLAEEDDADAIEVVVVRVGAEKYGLDVQRIREVHPIEGLIEVPGLPSIWGGLINLRGVLYPALDLASYLGLSPDVENRRHVVMVFSDEFDLGLLTGEVLGLRAIALEDVGPPIKGDEQPSPHAALGVTADLMVLLDLDLVLNDPSLVLDQRGPKEGV